MSNVIIPAQPQLVIPKKCGGRRVWDFSGFKPLKLCGPKGECPFCGGHVAVRQHRRGALQTLAERLIIHSRDCGCTSRECPSPETIFRPLEEQRLRLRLCGYGIDVVYLVIDRYFGGMSLPAIHQLLTEKYGVQISQTHVGNLLRLGLALVRCRDVTNQKLRARLMAQGGIVLSADAVNFDETSPALYVLRDVLSAEVLVARRLQLRGAEQIITLFEEVRKLDVPVLGIISDKEAAFVEAASEVFPGSPHQFCQPHYLLNLAKPMDVYSQLVGRGVRTVVREVRAIEKAVLKHQDHQYAMKPPAIEQQGEVKDASRAEASGKKKPETGAECGVVLQLCSIVAAVGKSRGDSLLDPTPLKRYEKLESVQQAAEKAKKREGGPWPLVEKLLTAFAVLVSYKEQAAFLLRQVAVLRAIAHILNMEHVSGEAVKASLQAYLDALRGAVSEADKKSGWSSFVEHVLAVSKRFWKGLFHCYDTPKLPSNNNATESFFGAIKRFSRRVTGRQCTSGGPIETCAEFFVEAFPLFRNSAHPELLAILSEIPAKKLDQARDEFEKLARPAKNKRSIARNLDRALEEVLKQWCPPLDSS